MVDALIALICLPVLAYYAGIIVNRYTKEETAKWAGKIRLAITYLPVLILLASLLNINSLNIVYALFVFSLSVIVFTIIPSVFLKKNDAWLDGGLSGIIIGAGRDNYLVIILLCAYYYFKANYSSYSKEKYSKLLENILFLSVSVIIVMVNIPEILPLGVLGLLILRIRLR